MARIRTIKPEFFTSPDTAKASVEARLFYIALWCWADDWGIGEANLNALLGFAFPESDEKTRKEVQSLCKEVFNTYGTVFYQNNGRHFYQILSWDDHQKTQRKAKRKNPTHDDPESTPDMRIYSEQEVSEIKQGTSESMQGNDRYGTGEKEQGKGNSVLVSDFSDEKPRREKLPEPDPAFQEDGELRKDVATILDRIDNHCAEHDFKEPARTKQNIAAARLMLDKDGRTLDQIIWLVDWVTSNSFWAPNIRSAAKLREKFDQLAGQARNQAAPQQNFMTADQRRLQAALQRDQAIAAGQFSPFTTLEIEQ